MEFNHDFGTLNGIHDASERVQLAEDFLNATTRDDYAALHNKYTLLFGQNTTITGQRPEDVGAVCEVMRKANEMFALSQLEGDIDISDLLAVGLSPVFTGVVAPDDEFTIEKAEHFSMTYIQKVGGGAYRFWLSDAAKRVAERFPWYRKLFYSMAYENGFLHYNADQRPMSEFGMLRDECKKVLQQLITLHLADVATVCDKDPISPMQMAYSGISCIWLGLAERMSGGRADRCHACGKPFVAYNERRRQIFCCPACRKWKGKHPNEMRGYWYYEKR